MDTNELKMTDLWPSCQNNNPLIHLPKDAEILEFDNCGDAGYIVAIDFADESSETKLRKLHNYVENLYMGGGINFSFLLLRFRKNDTQEQLFHTAVVMYLAGKTQDDIDYICENHLTTCGATHFVEDSDSTDGWTENFLMLSRDADGITTMHFDYGESREVTPNQTFCETLRNCCQYIEKKTNAQFEGFAIAPAAASDQEAKQRKMKGEIIINQTKQHFSTCCINENQMTLIPKDSDLPLIDTWGSEGYLVAIDNSADDYETKFSKLHTLTQGLNGYAVSFSILLLRFRDEQSFFYPAIVMYMKRNNEAGIEHLCTLEYYARKAMDNHTDDYVLLHCEKGNRAMLAYPDFDYVNYIDEQPASRTIRTACELLSLQNKSRFEGFAIVPTGVPSGFKDLDILTSGWQKSELIVIAGKPTTGKSAFALSMIRNIAYESDCKIPCAMFSLEMSKERLDARFTMIVGNKASMDNVIEFPLYIDDTPRLSVSELDKRLTQLVSEKGVKIAFIDYIQLMDSPELVKTPSRREEFRKTMEYLKELAVRLDIPIIALMMQYSIDKDQNGKINKSKPQLSDLHFSDIIDKYADTVAFIQYADEDENIDEKDVQFVIAKQSNEILGTVTLKLDTKKACFI